MFPAAGGTCLSSHPSLTVPPQADTERPSAKIRKPSTKILTTAFSSRLVLRAAIGALATVLEFAFCVLLMANAAQLRDRKSTRLNSSHGYISYAVFCLKKKDVISSFGGKTSYVADTRPLLVMRSNLWASSYVVDGTDHTSLGQFSGRVQQTSNHSVPRFFVPEHGTMFFFFLVRRPPPASTLFPYPTPSG